MLGMVPAETGEEVPLLAPVMAMILPCSWTVLTGPDSGTAFILAAEDVMLS